MITKTERKWNDPPLDTGYEKRWGIIGAIIYPCLCLIALAMAHYVFEEPIILDSFGLLILILSPLLGALFFWSGASILSWCKQ